MKVYKRLFNNTLIFGIGDIGSKGIAILLVPLYTFYLSKSDYGLVDITQITINLIVPIISLSVFEAVLRYVMDKKDVTSVFTNGFLITCVSSLITVLICFVLSFFITINNILPYLCIITVLQLFHSLISQFIRGIGEIKLYTISGLILAFVIAIMNFITLIWLQLGINGYFLSIITGLIVSILLISIKIKIINFIDISTFSLKLNKELLKYSMPLIPNSFMWWIINASSRYFILIFAGTTYNGLFAVASKIPGILSIFNSIFLKAWQLSAIEESKSENRLSFFSSIFNYFQQFMFIVITIALLLIKFIFECLMGDNFYDAWKYVPFLLVGVLFSSFSSFLGTNYVVSKETKGVFKTSIFGGIANLTLNIVTIPLLGVIGASISSMVSFILMAIIRWHDTKRFIKIQYNYKNICINLVLIFSQILVMYLNLNRIRELIIQIIIMILVLISNKQLIKRIFIITLKIFKQNFKV